MCTVTERKEAMLEEVAQIIGKKHANKLNECFSVWAKEMIDLESALDSAVEHIEELEVKVDKLDAAELLKAQQAAQQVLDNQEPCLVDALIPQDSLVKEQLRLEAVVAKQQLQQKLDANPSCMATTFLSELFENSDKVSSWISRALDERYGL